MSESNGYATLDDIAGLPFKRRYADVELDFEGVTRKFRLQSLNDLEKEEYDAVMVNGRGKLNRRAAASQDARLVALCWVDGEGNRVCGDGAVAKLQARDGGSVGRLAVACREHCGLNEEPEKNSEETADADSLTS